MREVIVYSTPTCPYCQKTKEWLDKRNIKYKDVNVAEDHEAAKIMMEESKQQGVPVVKTVEDGKVKSIIAGYDIESLEKEFT